MARAKAMLATSLAVLAALGQSASLSDSVSAVQGMVRAHQHAKADNCADIRDEVEEPLPPSLANEAEIVVVRGAGEDVRWLDAVPEISAVIYDRSGLPEMLPKARSNLKVVKQENIGREDDAMLRHIIDRYDNLAQNTFFLQGWPFWHCGGTLELIRRAVKNLAHPTDADFVGSGAQSGLVPMAATFYQYDVAKGLTGNWGIVTFSSRDKHNTNPTEVRQAAIKSFNDTCSQILDKPCPNHHWVSEGSQWAVSRDRIRQRPVSFYKRLLDLTPDGGELHKKRLRGLILEAVWPTIWGAPGWSPSEQLIKNARTSKDLNSVIRTDAMGQYCNFATDRFAYPTPSERRGVCALEKHATGSPGSYGSVNLNSQGWSPHAELRPVIGHSITKKALEMGSTLTEGSKPKPQHTATDPVPFCQKRHIFPVQLLSHLKNKATGKCIQHNTGSFGVSDCVDQAESQQLRFSSAGNQGSWQILDKSEANCLSHTAMTGAKCKLGPDGGALRTQQFDLLQEGNGTYRLKLKGSDVCMAHSQAGLETGGCIGHSSLWEFSDISGMGQYWNKFDFSMTQMADGKLALRCIMRLHSYDDKVGPDFNQPEWRKRGRVAGFELIDAPDGAYYLKERNGGATARYVGCDSSDAAVFQGEKVAWHVKPVSDGFVHLESGGKALSFIMLGGKVMCTPMKDGVPPQDSTFALEFVHGSTHTL